VTMSRLSWIRRKYSVSFRFEDDFTLTGPQRSIPAQLACRYGNRNGGRGIWSRMTTEY
jgi:hypothetical protein